MPKVSEKYKIQKRAQLMESAFRCFAANGYVSTTIEDIAKDSKVAKGVIYNYFSSKEEILLQIMDQHTKRFFVELESMLKDISDPMEKLKTVFAKFKAPPGPESIDQFRIFMEYWIYSSRNPQMGQTYFIRHHLFVELFLKIIKEGQEAGSFNPSVDPKAISSLLWSLRDGSLLHYFSLKDDELIVNMWSHAEDMLFRQLQPDQSRE